MAKYFCADCGYEGDEQICPYCYKPAESLDVDLEGIKSDEKYSEKDIDGSIIDGEELADDLDKDVVDDQEE